VEGELGEEGLGRERKYLGGEGGGFFGGAEELGGFCALDVFDLLVVEEADAGAAPYYPVSIMLFARQMRQQHFLFPGYLNSELLIPPAA